MNDKLLKLREFADAICDLLCNRQRLELFASLASNLGAVEVASADAKALAARLPRLLGEARIEGMSVVIAAIESLREKLGE